MNWPLKFPVNSSSWFSSLFTVFVWFGLDFLRSKGSLRAKKRYSSYPLEAGSPRRCRGRPAGERPKSLRSPRLHLVFAPLQHLILISLSSPAHFREGEGRRRNFQFPSSFIYFNFFFFVCCCCRCCESWSWSDQIGSVSVPDPKSNSEFSVSDPISRHRNYVLTNVKFSSIQFSSSSPVFSSNCEG